KHLCETPSHLPMKKVAPPAADPIRSIRNPPQSAPRPVNKLIVAPTQKSEAAAMAIDERSADGPAVTVKGINGRKAPRPKESSDERAARHGEPSSCGLRPSSSRARVSSAFFGSEISWFATRLASSLDSPRAW